MMKVDRHVGIQNPFQIIQKIILYLKIFKFNSIKYLKSFLPPVFPPQPQARFPFPFFFGFFTFVHIAFSSLHRFYIEFDSLFFHHIRFGLVFLFSHQVKIHLILHLVQHLLFFQHLFGPFISLKTIFFVASAGLIIKLVKNYLIV